MVRGFWLNIYISSTAKKPYPVSQGIGVKRFLRKVGMKKALNIEESLRIPTRDP